MTKKQAFQILEVDETATPTEIKQAWKDMVFFWHPDRYQDNERRLRFAEEKTKLINEAFDRIQNGRFDETQTEYPKQNGNQPPDPPWTPPNNPKKKSRKLVNRVVFAILACYLLLILIKPFHKRAAWLEPDSQPQNEPPETTHVYPNEEPVSDLVTEPLRSPERESVPAIETQAPPPTQPKEKPKPPVEKKFQPYWLNNYRMYHQRTQSTAEIAREVNLLIEKAQIEMLEAEIKHVGLADSVFHVQDQLNRKRKARQRHKSYSGRLLDEEWLKDQIKTEKAVTRWREQGMTTKEIFDAVKSIIQKQIADHEKKYPRD